VRSTNLHENFDLNCTAISLKRCCFVKYSAKYATLQPCIQQDVYPEFMIHFLPLMYQKIIQEGQLLFQNPNINWWWPKMRGFAIQPAKVSQTRSWKRALRLEGLTDTYIHTYTHTHTNTHTHTMLGSRLQSRARNRKQLFRD